MKKITCLLIIAIVISVVFLSGCEQKGTEVERPKLITLDSKVVTLVYSSLNFSKDGSGKVIRADVEYLFKNIANKVITIEVFAKFYDKNNNLLATGGPKEIGPLPVGYTEQNILGANTISYSGEDAFKVDHVTLVVKEKTT